MTNVQCNLHLRSGEHARVGYLGDNAKENRHVLHFGNIVNGGVTIFIDYPELQQLRDVIEQHLLDVDKRDGRITSDDEHDDSE